MTIPPIKTRKIKSVIPVTTSLEELDQHIIALQSLRKEKKVIEESIADEQQKVLDVMTQHNIKDYKVSHGNDLFKASMMQNTSRAIDESKLKRKVGPGIWRRITTLSLDRKKVDALVADGTIDPVDLAACITETPSKPFVKVT